MVEGKNDQSWIFWMYNQDKKNKCYLISHIHICRRINMENEISFFIF